MQIKTFSRKIERNFERTIPPGAISIVRHLVRDIARKSSGSSEIDQRLEFAHAALHMQIYQRYGTRSSGFIQHAHNALDELISDVTHSSVHLKLPTEFKAPA